MAVSQKTNYAHLATMSDANWYISSREKKGYISGIHFDEKCKIIKEFVELTSGGFILILQEKDQTLINVYDFFGKDIIMQCKFELDVLREITVDRSDSFTPNKIPMFKTSGDPDAYKMMPASPVCRNVLECYMACSFFDSKYSPKEAVDYMLKNGGRHMKPIDYQPLIFKQNNVGISAETHSPKCDKESPIVSILKKKYQFDDKYCYEYNDRYESQLPDGTKLNVGHNDGEYVHAVAKAIIKGNEITNEYIYHCSEFYLTIGGVQQKNTHVGVGYRVDGVGKIININYGFKQEKLYDVDVNHNNISYRITYVSEGVMTESSSGDVLKNVSSLPEKDQLLYVFNKEVLNKQVSPMELIKLIQKGNKYYPKARYEYEPLILKSIQ